MKKKNILKLMLAASVLAGCTSTSSAAATTAASTSEVYKNTDLAAGIFDTTYAYQEAPKTDQSADNYQYSLTQLKEYSDLYDIYNNYDGVNNLKTINDNAGIAPVKVDQKIIDMLLLAKQFYTYSDGEFDITMGALLKVWHTYREAGITLNEQGQNAPIPTEAELEAVKDYHGWDKVIIDDDADTVYITDPNVSLDVGGIAKGYATEQVAADMENNKGVGGGYLNVGRNIRLLGGKTDGSAWRIGITDPASTTGDSLLALDVPNSYSVVTSGDYERYYTGVDGNRYSHIIDPQTLFPATYYHSVSIITDDSGVADCLSTTLFTMTIADGKKALAAYEAATGKKVSVVWIMDQNKTQGETGKTAGSYFVAYTDDLESTLIWY
jgi:thiamine biosynthesis lipoprotein